MRFSLVGNEFWSKVTRFSNKKKSHVVCEQFNADSYYMSHIFWQDLKYFCDFVFEVGTYLRKIALHAEFRDFKLSFWHPLKLI